MNLEKALKTDYTTYILFMSNASAMEAKLKNYDLTTVKRMRDRYICIANSYKAIFPIISKTLFDLTVIVDDMEDNETFYEDVNRLKKLFAMGIMGFKWTCVDKGYTPAYDVFMSVGIFLGFKVLTDTIQKYRDNQIKIDELYGVSDFIYNTIFKLE